MTESSTEMVPIAQIWAKIFASIFARVSLALTIVFALIFGCFIGCSCLFDPDTCWLLTVGRYIIEHHAVPATDPYSYTFAMQQLPFVPYQWLGEVFFYLAYQVHEAISLVIFVAIMLTLAFWVIPARAKNVNAPTLNFLLLGTVGSVAACFHFLARPEIYSYVCLPLCIVLIRRSRTIDDKKMDWSYIGQMCALMVVWANLHSAFILGLLFQLVANLLRPVENKLRKSPAYWSRTGLIALVASGLATLINPRGVGLWLYLPGLFFAPFNYMIQELRPLRAADLHEFTYYPFMVFVIMTTVLFVRAIASARREKTVPPLLPFASNLILVYFALTCRRMIPFAVLNTLMTIHDVYIVSNPAGLPKYSFWDDLNKRIAATINVRGWFFNITLMVIVIYGAFAGGAYMSKAAIPRSSQAFKVPVDAVKFIEQKVPAGRVFDDAQYGDLLIWHKIATPVFIDTRYDMYGKNLIADYLHIIDSDQGWEKLLDQYKIDWVFVPAKKGIAEKLAVRPDWKLIFGDKTAVIYKRLNPTDSSGR